MRKLPCVVVVWFQTLLLMIGGCSRTHPTESGPAVAQAESPAGLPGIHNLRQVGPGLYSGSTPAGPAGFQSLRDLGIRTIISVDGAIPDANLARNAGMRYVHCPIGYDGIPRERMLQLSRAVRDLPGPVFIHCHHGKHRGPTAAVVVRLCLDPDYTPGQAIEEMRQAGTDPHYLGLYRLPDTLVRPSAEEIDSTSPDFPEKADISDLTRMMIQVDRHWENLGKIRSAGWKTPPDHPDLLPGHEATLLSECFREAARHHSPATAFRASDLWAAAEEKADRLKKTLQTVPIDPNEAESAYTRLSGECRICHSQMRDPTNMK